MSKRCKGVLYVLNTLIVPVNFDEYPSVRINLRRIGIEEAKTLLSSNKFTSAVGHEATAKVLSAILGVDIPTNRITIFMEPGDRAIHFFLKQRLPEGKVLSDEELRQLEYWLVLSEVEV